MNRSFARALSSSLVVAAAAVAMLLPSRDARADEGSAFTAPVVVTPPLVPTRDDVQLRDEAHPGMLIGGLGTLALFYGNSVAFTATSSQEHVEPGYIPVAGPFIAAATLKHPTSDDFLDLDFSDVDRGVFVALGVGQVVGAVLTIVGATTLHAPPASDASRIHFAPVASSTAAGLVVAGSL